jgi:hypothetical protein
MAVPLVNVTLASVVAPSLKVTVPVGVPPFVADTVAVNPTVVPNVTSVLLAIRLVVVPEATTSWLNDDELALEFVLPE